MRVTRLTVMMQERCLGKAQLNEQSGLWEWQHMPSGQTGTANSETGASQEIWNEEKRVREFRDSLKNMMDHWDVVYAAALKSGPHNPDGTKERAEQLTRAYMSKFVGVHP